MTEYRPKYDFQPVVCDACHGTGKSQSPGVRCKECSGIGGGVFSDGHFFYWRRELSINEIVWYRARLVAETVLDFIAFFLGLAGFLGLLWWIWSFPLSDFFVYRSSSFGDILADYDKLAFWQAKHWLLLLFWTGAMSCLFIIFRLSRKKERQDLISRRVIGKKKRLNTWDDVRSAIRNKTAIEVSRFFGRGAVVLLENAFMSAAKNGRNVEVIDLFAAWLDTRSAILVFSRMNGDIVKVLEAVARNMPERSTSSTHELPAGIKELLVDVFLDAFYNKQKAVDELNMVMPIVRRDEKSREILFDSGIDYDTIDNVVAWYRISDRLVENYELFVKSARFKPESNMDRAYTAVATPVLNHFSSDLTLAAKWGRLDISVGRDREIGDVFSAWESGKNGIILIGPPGIGKRNIAGGIAQMMVKEEVPAFLRDKRLVELDLARLMSGLAPEEVMERMMVVLDEISRAGNIVLYMEDIDNLSGVSASDGKGLDLSEVVANALAGHGFFCLATTTEDTYVKCLEGGRLADEMAKQVVAEPSGKMAIMMILAKIGQFESRHKLYFSYGAIRRSVEQSSRYIHDKFLPEKAFDILEAVAVRVSKDRGESSLIDEEDVSKAISEITGVPVAKVSEDEGKKLLQLEERLHERMIGQEEAVDMVAASLRRARTDMREGKRPIASFLFLGPTGVGKTELAKSVAQVYFGREDYMVRMDMSEYQLQGSVEKAIGNISGATGYLTEAVRKMPFSLVLLDEIEKAHPDILNLFLQVMDDGRLTDGQGRTIDFTNCIIIATSNAGAVYIQRQIAAQASLNEIKRGLIDEHLLNVMRPELINRFDGVIVFKPLSLVEVARIARLMLGEVAKMLEDKGIGLRVEEAGIIKLASAGYDPKFGARPLRRIIQDKVENSIANLLLSGELSRRDTVVIDSMAKIKVEKAARL